MDICNEMTQYYQDELHRPAFPYKFKIKVAGCACDCVAAIARADLSIIGTWKGNIRIDQAEVKKYADGGMDIQAEIIEMCPTDCMIYDGGEIKINDAQCNRCMHCIAKMTKALKQGEKKGASLLVGSKAPIVVGSLLSWVIVPFIELEAPFDNLKDIVDKMIEWWDDNAKPRERIGELIEVKGMRPFLEAIGVDPQPQQVKEPRKDPFFFWSESDFN
jgi:sulfite reductase alpha subunit